MSTTCEACGAPLGEGAAFCTGCGARRSANREAAGARRFCTNCGAAIAAGTRFCTGCGAPAEASGTPAAAPRGSVNEPRRPMAGGGVRPGPASSGAPQPAIQAAPAKPASWLPKVIIAGGVIVVLFVVAITATLIYVAHRVKQKAAQIEAASSVASLKAAAEAASGNHSKPSPSSAGGSSRPAAPCGWTLKDGKLVPAPCPFVPVAPPSPPTPLVPVAATGNQAHDWALKYERTENGTEADLVVRTGDINNLGFGWPQEFDPFSGKSTPPHPFPWEPRAGAPDGTDRIMIGSALEPPADYTHFLVLNDGYSGILKVCEGLRPPPGQICRQRQESMPQAVRLPVGALPPKINAVLFQLFVDDFQAAVFRSHFQVSLNGTRIPSFEQAINSLDQTGPIGKLVSLKLLPEYWPLLKSGEVKLLIDDPTTKQGDGYALDFVRILVNPHNFKYEVSLTASVVDADKHTPIPGSTVTAGMTSAATDQSGKCHLSGLPAGLAVVTAAAPGYDENSVTVDLVAGQSGNAEIQLHRHQEGTADLERAIQQTGSATVYGIHFDTDSAKLRPDSMPALNAVLGLINNHPGSRWIIAGHTDNQGNAGHNQTLSENRAGSVIAWLKGHGVDAGRLVPQGFGATRPVADNATANGRALNRRVEVALAK